VNAAFEEKPGREGKLALEVKLPVWPAVLNSTKSRISRKWSELYKRPLAWQFGNFAWAACVFAALADDRVCSADRMRQEDREGLTDPPSSFPAETRWLGS